jgi:hypothetical protein
LIVACNCAQSNVCGWNSLVGRLFNLGKELLGLYMSPSARVCISSHCPSEGTSSFRRGNVGANWWARDRLCDHVVAHRFSGQSSGDRQWCARYSGCVKMVKTNSRYINSRCAVGRTNNIESTETLNGLVWISPVIRRT